MWTNCSVTVCLLCHVNVIPTCFTFHSCFILVFLLLNSVTNLHVLSLDLQTLFANVLWPQGWLHALLLLWWWIFRRYLEVCFINRIWDKYWLYDVLPAYLIEWYIYGQSFSYVVKCPDWFEKQQDYTVKHSMVARK